MTTNENPAGDDAAGFPSDETEDTSAALTVPEIDPDDDNLTAAMKWANARWYVVPVARGSKNPGSVVGKNWQRQSSRDPKQIAAWFAGTEHGIAVHCGRSGAVVVDVDRPNLIPADWHKHLKTAPCQSTRPSTIARGHYFFAMPPGRSIGNPNIPGSGGEIRGLNGVVLVANSFHPDGGEYRLRRTGPVPVLPDDIATALSDTSPSEDAATDAQVTEFVAAHTGNTSRYALGVPVRKLRDAIAGGGSRHDATVSALVWAMEEARAGCYPADAAVTEIKTVFIDAIGRQRKPDDRVVTGAAAEWEFHGMLAWAVGQSSAKTDGELAARLARTTSAEPPADNDFWDSRESLCRIRDYALACLVSPWGVLGCCLVYALDTLPWHVALPGIGDDESPGCLSLFVALATASGGNKGRTVKVARQLLRRTLPDLSPGSGEGLVKCFVRPRPKDSDDEGFEINGDKYAWRTHNVVLNVPEVDVLAALSKRTAATLPSMLKSGWSGEQLGFGYADDTKRSFVPADQYRLGMIVGVQPENAGPLFADTSGGTPQRFLWLPTTDRRISRHNRPPKPDPVTLTEYLSWRSNPVFELCATAREDIEDAAEARANETGDPLDGHALFVRAKAAAALAVLANRVTVSDEDWRLAGVVMEMSDRTRSAVQRALGDAKQREAIQRGRTDGLSASIAAEVQHSRDVERVVGVLIRAAAKHGPMKRIELRRLVAGRDKHAATDALDLAIERGLLIEADGLVRVK